MRALPTVARDGSSARAAAGYGGQPVLHPAPWDRLVTWYFFSGGLSGAAYLIASVARGFGGERARATARCGYLVSAIALLPAPLLLVRDLGRPARFHHMLRTVKPLSPMNLGSWALAGFSAASLAAGLRSLCNLDALPLPRRLRTVGRLVPEVAAVPGSMVALFFSGYTGTLLAATAVPLWAETPLLGPLFMASSAATGTAAVEVALTLSGEDGEALVAVKTATLLGEAALAALLLGRLSATARRPLTSGGQRHAFLGGYVGAGLVAPLALSLLPQRRHPALRLAGAVATLAGGFCLRSAMVRGGAESARDPEAALATAG